MSEWQLIESAPKDGTWILTADTNGNVRQHRWLNADLPHRNNIAGWYCVRNWVTTNLTHWMPLPDPPAA